MSKEIFFLHKSTLQPCVTEARFNSCFGSLLKFPWQGHKILQQGIYFRVLGCQWHCKTWRQWQNFAICHLTSGKCALPLSCTRLIGRPWLFVMGLFVTMTCVQRPSNNASREELDLYWGLEKLIITLKNHRMSQVGKDLWDRQVQAVFAWSTHCRVLCWHLRQTKIQVSWGGPQGPQEPPLQRGVDRKCHFIISGLYDLCFASDTLWGTTQGVGFPNHS